MDTDFLITPPSLVETPLLTTSWAPHARLRNGQGYLHGSYRFHRSQVWDPLCSNKHDVFMQFTWNKVVDAVEDPCWLDFHLQTVYSLPPPPPLHQCIIQAQLLGSQPNSYEPGDGPHPSCMTSMTLEWTTISLYSLI